MLSAPPQHCPARALARVPAARWQGFLGGALVLTMQPVLLTAQLHAKGLRCMALLGLKLHTAAENISHNQSAHIICK